MTETEWQKEKKKKSTSAHPVLERGTYVVFAHPVSHPSANCLFFSLRGTGSPIFLVVLVALSIMVLPCLPQSPPRGGVKDPNQATPRRLTGEGMIEGWKGGKDRRLAAEYAKDNTRKEDACIPASEILEPCPFLSSPKT